MGVLFSSFLTLFIRYNLNHIGNRPLRVLIKIKKKNFFKEKKINNRVESTRHFEILESSKFTKTRN